MLRPSAMPLISSALPVVVPATVISAARVPLRGAGRDHQRHDRPRHEDQHDGDQQEGGEELVVHGTPLRVIVRSGGRSSNRMLSDEPD